jgi:Protein of unknown function (DUF2771)
VRRVVGVLAAVVVAVVAIVGVSVWLLVRGKPPQYPEISAYSHGHLTRVGPYRYCDVLNITDCRSPQAQGELPVSERYPVQLSVPTPIGEAPWRLLRVYADPRDTTTTLYRPDTRLAVTIPTTDPQRGRLMGVVVQLPTLVVDQNGEFADVPHAEWSVRTVWAE